MQRQYALIGKLYEEVQSTISVSYLWWKELKLFKLHGLLRGKWKKLTY